MSNNIITLGQITEMTAGDKDNPTWINDDFEAVVTNVKESKTKTNKVYYTASLQDPHSSNITLDATFWMNGIPAKQGKVCRFSGQGMKLEAYKGNLKLTIGDKATINVVGAAQNTANKPPVTQTKAAPGQTRAPAASGKRPINGATVGMAINQAIGIIKDTQPDAPLSGYYLTAAFGKDLHTLASDIIRVSTYLEAGNMADPSNKRNAPPPPPPAPEPEPEPAQNTGGDNGQAFSTDGPDDESVPF